MIGQLNLPGVGTRLHPKGGLDLAPVAAVDHVDPCPYLRIDDFAIGGQIGFPARLGPFEVVDGSGNLGAAMRLDQSSPDEPDVHHPALPGCFRNGTFIPYPVHLSFSLWGRLLQAQHGPFGCEIGTDVMNVGVVGHLLVALALVLNEIDRQLLNLCLGFCDGLGRRRRWWRGWRTTRGNDNGESRRQQNHKQAA